jgi:hypothetical protein
VVNGMPDSLLSIGTSSETSASISLFQRLEKSSYPRYSMKSDIYVGHEQYYVRQIHRLFLDRLPHDLECRCH